MRKWWWRALRCWLGNARKIRQLEVQVATLQEETAKLEQDVLNIQGAVGLLKQEVLDLQALVADLQAAGVMTPEIQARLDKIDADLDAIAPDPLSAGAAARKSE